MREGDFADRLLAWFDRHGRTDLPWQQNPTPYRVWVSEIMLQQTQVGTVIAYFERFMAEFPSLRALAEAPADAVMAGWAGLGYYSRARNLHAAARRCLAEHGGELPRDLGALIELPGIGRSTAGAILALSDDQRHPILDGNVKRVLARHRAVEGWPGRSAVARALWQIAEARTPRQRVAAYTQAIMDLGATVCTPRHPRCEACPVATDCLARARGQVDRYPGRKPARPLPRRKAVLAVLRQDDRRLLLERRPPSGIWGGLWCLPQFETVDQAGERFGLPVAAAEPFEHTFTHFRWEITPWRFEAVDGEVHDGVDARWFDPAEVATLGLPQPIRQWIGQLFEDQVTWHEKSTA